MKYFVYHNFQNKLSSWIMFQKNIPFLTGNHQKLLVTAGASNLEHVCVKIYIYIYIYMYIYYIYICIYIYIYIYIYVYIYICCVFCGVSYMWSNKVFYTILVNFKTSFFHVLFLVSLKVVASIFSIYTVLICFKSFYCSSQYFYSN